MGLHLPMPWVLEIRVLRGVFYAGAIFMHYTGWTTLLTSQIILSKNRKFIEKITLKHIIFSAMLLVAAFCLIIAIVMRFFIKS